MNERKKFYEYLFDESYNALFILLLIITVIFISASLIIFYFFGIHRKGVTEFGNAINIVSTLFSALAFGALIYTIILQRRELQETRNEFKTQSKIFLHQKFDDSFFSLFNLHQGTLREMQIVAGINGAVLHEGKDCFNYFIKGFSHELTEQKTKLQLLSIKELSRDQVREAYELFYKKGKKYFSQYIRSLENLLRVISESELHLVDQRFYVNVIKTQLTSNELLILFYAALYQPPFVLEGYAVRFQLFEFLDEDKLFSITHSDWIDREAFRWADGC